MTKQHDGGPMFAAATPATEWDNAERQRGTSVRVWLTGQAMTLFSFDREDALHLQAGDIPDHPLAARFCVDFADATLAELARPKGGETVDRSDGVDRLRGIDAALEVCELVAAGSTHRDGSEPKHIKMLRALHELRRGAGGDLDG